MGRECKRKRKDRGTEEKREKERETERRRGERNTNVKENGGKEYI